MWYFKNLIKFIRVGRTQNFLSMLKAHWHKTYMLKGYPYQLLAYREIILNAIYVNILNEQKENKIKLLKG